MKFAGTLAEPLQNQLRRVLLRSELLKKGQELQDIAYSTPGRNRAVLTEGHKKTTEWIYNQFLKLSDYYTVEYHEFITEVAFGAVTVDGTQLNAEGLTFSPKGKVTAALVAVPNLGCDAVR